MTRASHDLDHGLHCIRSETPKTRGVQLVAAVEANASQLARVPLPLLALPRCVGYGRVHTIGTVSHRAVLQSNSLDFDIAQVPHLYLSPTQNRVRRNPILPCQCLPSPVLPVPHAQRPVMFDGRPQGGRETVRHAKHRRLAIEWWLNRV